MELELRERLGRIHEDLKVALSCEGEFKLTKEEVSDVSEFMDMFLYD